MRRGRQGTILAVIGLPEALVHRLLHSPEDVLWQPESVPVKISRASLVVRTAWDLGGQVVPVAYRRCRPKNAWKSLCALVRRAQALRNWHMGRALLARGIATAEPLLVYQPRRWRWPRESYLATRWIDGAENLHLWAWRLANAPAHVRLRAAAACATGLGRLVGRMHAQGVSHRDLKGANLLVRDADNPPSTWLVDLEGARIRRRLGPRRRAADLARLAVSLEAHPWITPAVAYRFLVAYAAQFPDGAIDPKRLWRQVARRAAARIQRKRRRGEEIL